MKEAVRKMVQECDVCHRSKAELVAPSGLLEPLPMLGVWEEISMDFIEGLPLSSGKSAVMVVVDRFSKFAHFISLKHPFAAQSVTQVFFNEIFKLYGLPKSIISDRYRIFMSNFWSELFQLQGTKLLFSTAYYTQTDI